MDHLLQIVLALVGVVLAACLVPLLLQLHRTARSMQALAESAREDLKQISQDVHQARLQLDKLAGLTERSLEFPATASTLASTLLRTLTGGLTGGATPWLEALVTIVKICLDFFRRPPKAAPTKETDNE